MNFLVFLIFLPMILAQSVNSGNFTVIAPSDIRRGKPFNVIVKGFNLKSAIQLTLTISGATKFGSSFSTKRLARLSAQKLGTLIQFDTNSVIQGSYTLTVSSGSYSQSKSLNYKTNEYAFFIQTDKAIYFPSDLIRFRVFAVDSETKSVNPRYKTNVIIKEAEGSVVSNIIDAKFVKGKYQSELQLTSDLGRIGFWAIQVQSGNDTGEKIIEVAEYSEPVIYAALEIPPKVPFSAGVIPIVINVANKFNAEIGTANVTFNLNGTKKFRQQISIHENVTNFDVNIVGDLNATSARVFSYNVSLEFTDSMTNATVTDSTIFEVLPKAYSIILSGDPYLTPGNDFNFYIVVVSYDATPGPAGMTVDIKVESLDVSQTLELDDNGSASFSFNVPVGTSSILLKATSDDTTDASLNVTLALPIPGTVNDTRRTTMRLDVITREPAINAQVEVELTLNETVDVVTCLIVAKGVLLETIEVPIPYRNQTLKTVKFSFTPTFAYAPFANIIGYFMRIDGRIVTASTSVQLTGALNNFLTLSLTQSEVKSGERIEVKAESFLNSTVYLAAVDQRIASLRDGNSLTSDEIFGSLLKFYDSASNNAKDIPDYEFVLNFYGLIFFTNIPVHPSSYQFDNTSLTSQLNQSNILSQVISANLGVPRSIKASQAFARSILWQNVDIKTPDSNDTSKHRGIDGVAEIASQDIASYIVYGISMSPYTGIGLPRVNPIIRFFKTFFISAEFPYSIKVSETLVQSITVYNFLQQSQKFDLKINKNSKYEIDLSSSPGWVDSGSSYIRILTSQVGVHSRVHLAIKALQVGVINFKIIARGPIAGDTIVRVLRITPVGVYKTSSESKVFYSRGRNELISNSLSCSVPNTHTNVVSVKLTFHAISLLRPVTKLSIGLIHMPYGNGETIFILMTPDIVFLRYYIATNQITLELQNTFSYYLNAGYQNSLRFIRYDGSLSAFGEYYDGSTWLTAYAGWNFYQIKDVISLDLTIIQKGLNFLSTRQQSDGSFVEFTPVLHTDMDGGVGTDITLTAYITIYITMVVEDFPEFKPMQQKAVTYLENNWQIRTDVYGLAIIAYALKLAGSLKTENIMNFFYMSRTETDTEIYYDSVETTAYCLLLLLVRGERLADAEKIANYLTRVSVNFDSYFYSQDTVMGIYALTKYAEFTQLAGKTEIEISSNIGNQISTNFDPSVPLEQQTITFDNNVRSIDVTTKSAAVGNLLMTLTCAYYEDSLSFLPAFKIVYKFTFTCKNQIIIQIFINFIPAGKSTGKTEAVVTLPSGFVFINLYEGSDVKKVETTNNGEVVKLSFDSMTNTPSSAEIGAVRGGKVYGKMEGYIQVNEVFNPANAATTKFVLPELVDSCGIVSR